MSDEYQPTRRVALGAGLSFLGASLFGCPPNVSEPTGRYSRTGVPGLDTPDQILSNSDVRDAIDQVRDLGYNVQPFRDSIDPPNIEGSYSIAGNQLIPFEVPLASGTFRWSNQTHDNNIDTDYDQLIQSGVSNVGEIIRGSGNEFTVYSIIDIQSDVGLPSLCRNRSVLIMDGAIDSQGVFGLYFGIPTRNFTPLICNVFPVAGEFDFRRTKSDEVPLDRLREFHSGLAAGASCFK
jgi:hypothetical protein